MMMQDCTQEAALSILVVHTGVAPAEPGWSTVVGGGATAEILVGSALWAVIWLVVVTYEWDNKKHNNLK